MKKLLLFFFVLAISTIIFSGCSGSSAEYKYPDEYNFDKEKVINQSFDVVWQKLIDWFASHNTPIKTLDKSSGIIASDYELSTSEGNKATNERIIDCGTSLHGAKNAIGIEITHLRFENQRGNFNVSVKKIDDNSTKVTINFFAKSDLNQYDVNGRLVYSQIVTCNSTGYLEKQIFEAISK